MVAAGPVAVAMVVPWPLRPTICCAPSPAARCAAAGAPEATTLPPASPGRDVRPLGATSGPFGNRAPTRRPEVTGGKLGVPRMSWNRKFG